MRVIAGSAKGHKLKSIQGLNTRPTQDRVKESIFNIIIDYISDSTVLDLFSGTGSLAIEALSRGAKFAVLVDNNYLCVKVIKENLIHTKFQDKAKVIKDDVISAIKKMKINNKFDIIFMDPPYNEGKIIPTLNEIFNNKILTENGLIVVERSKNDILTDIPFRVMREQRYGDTIVSFLKNK